MKNIYKLIILIILLILSLTIFYDYYNKIILIMGIIVFLLIIGLIVYIIIKGIKTKKQSIIVFLKKIERGFKNKENEVNKIFDFNRQIKYKKQIIPLGKLIIDNETNRILLYETFYNPDNFFVCIPDVRILKQDNLKKCYIVKNGENATIEELDEFFNNVEKKHQFYKDVSLIMTFRHCIVDGVILKLSSINDYEIFKNMYLELAKILEKKKK